MALPNDKPFYRHRGYQYPTAQIVEILHENAIKDYGGLLGIRDPGALESALSAPLVIAGEEDAYPTFFNMNMVATIGFRFAKNHPFNDANKRTTWLTVVATLKRNGYYPRRPDTELEDMMVLLAAGHDIAGFWVFLLIACNQDYTDERL